ncbi:alpha/beta hydrolase-fold protein [Pseudonocardia sp. 73-21]|uniref:alpha/beta hydrolase n=1 Tax=Pseudonocardia sp. 73-21 TaxID=1895809 RepID=UPI00095E1CA1|nr:alpha/beta hydrolase-fold protein [Pseudonocardia sp. 73-21]OJY45284.1 MAG: enterochelin esterase [Pseudonocardia sp. 73-21]
MTFVPPDIGPPWARPLAGRLDVHAIDSPALRGNALGDPHVRPLAVYVPPGAEDAGALPVIYVIQGFTGQLDRWAARSTLRPTYLELVDDLFADPAVPRALVAHVDAWTSIGGSQFVDSPATGRYATYLCEDVVSFVDAHYATRADRDHRGIAGKSSGGYGAMVNAMLRPDVFGALATHAGDACFETCYLHDEAASVRALRESYDGSWENFLADLRSRPAMSKGTDGDILNSYAMAACYSADPDGTVHHPIDPATGVLDDEVWARWQAWDPVRMAPRHAEALRSMRAIWIDAGTRDEWFLDLGAQAFRDACETAGATVTHFELFDAGHGGIEYRYPLALRHLAERLAAATFR